MLIQNTLVGIKKDAFDANSLYDDLISVLSAQANSGQPVVNVVSGTNFTVGECIVIYDQVTNAFETATIQSKSGNTLTMTANLVNTYGEKSYCGKYIGYLDTVNRKYKRRPGPDLGTGADGAFVSSGNATWNTEKNFTSVTIQSGHTITITADVEIKCQGAFVIQAGGKLSAKGQGHAGGSSDHNYAYQGTSELGVGISSRSANGGGGGAGYCNDSSYRAGGGGGAFGSNGSNGGAYSGGQYGYGGIAYNDPAMTNNDVGYRKGSGGGGGYYYYGGSGAGGNGGGIIRISCLSLSVAGEIDCDGNNGGDAWQEYSGVGAGGGGGAGGSIRIICLVSATIGTNLIHASGGTGGTGYDNAYGGNGGVGRIRIEAPSITGTSTPTLATGYFTGFTGYTKFGFYFTHKIVIYDPSITVNAYIRQNIVVNELIGATVNSGQKNCSVVDGTKYEVGDVVVVREGTKIEKHIINSKDGNVLTMVDNFTNSYTTAGKVFRIDCAGYCSLKTAGAGEAQEAMTLKEINFELNDTAMLLVFSKTIKTDNNGNSGTELVGMVRLKDVEKNNREVAMREVNWEYF